MEYKLLNFNRFMANFSTKLVGGFVPIIVYKYATSNKLLLSILTLVIQFFCSYLFGLIFRTWLIKKPQLFLFLRIIPICIYEVLLLFVDTNPIACVVGIGLAFSLSYTFKNIPVEVLFSYTNASKKRGTGRNLAISTLIDRSSLILGVLIGGFVLDYLDMRILIVLSIILYFIGSMPLLINYFKHRKDKNYNQEYSSYAHLSLKEKSNCTKYANSVSKKIRIIYCLYYFLQESAQAIYTILPLILYVFTGKFIYAAIASAIFDAVFGLGCYLTGILESRRDITIMASASGIMVGITAISLMFIKNNTIWLSYILIGIMSICYSIAYFFMYHRMIMKSKIVGRNTTCVVNKINMFYLSTGFIASFGLFLPIISCLCVGGIMSILGGIFTPFVEEKTRRLLVDHLEDNEIRQGSIFDKKNK